MMENASVAPSANPVHDLCQRLGITFVVLDCGSGSADGLGLKNIFPCAKIHAIEPRSESNSPPSEVYQGGVRISHDVALSSANGTRTLYVTRIPEASSLLKPNLKNLARWRGTSDNDFDILEERQIKCQTLEHFGRTHDLSGFDLIKLDTQGTELDILLSGKELVRKTGAILMEVEFVRLYENQSLFGEVVGELSKLGFRFVNFLHGHSIGLEAGDYAPQKRIWCDTLFIRDDETVGPDEATRIGIILCELGYQAEARWFMEDRRVPEDVIVATMVAYKQLDLLKAGALTRGVIYPFAVFLKNHMLFGKSTMVKLLNKFSLGRRLIGLIHRP